MFGKLNHLAITRDHYTCWYVLPRHVRSQGIGRHCPRNRRLSVGDGYVGMTLIPRHGGPKAGSIIWLEVEVEYPTSR